MFDTVYVHVEILDFKCDILCTNFLMCVCVCTYNILSIYEIDLIARKFTCPFGKGRWLPVMTAHALVVVGISDRDG